MSARTCPRGGMIPAPCPHAHQYGEDAPECGVRECTRDEVEFVREATDAVAVQLAVTYLAGILRRADHSGPVASAHASNAASRTIYYTRQALASLRQIPHESEGIHMASIHGEGVRS